LKKRNEGNTMSITKSTRIPQCPKCGEELPEIQGWDVTGDARLLFSKKRGKYILCIAILDIERFPCPKCDTELKTEWLDNHRNKHLLAVNPSGLYKTFIVDLQDLPFDVAYAEFDEKLPKLIGLESKEKKETEESEKKE